MSAKFYMLHKYLFTKIVLSAYLALLIGGCTKTFRASEETPSPVVSSASPSISSSPQETISSDTAQLPEDQSSTDSENEDRNVNSTSDTNSDRPAICEQARPYECEGIMLQLAENELDLTLKRVLSELGSIKVYESSGTIGDEIDVAQKAWVNYRDKSCSLEVDLSNTLSSRPIRGRTLSSFYQVCRTEKTKERTKYLVDLLAKKQP